MVPGRSVSRVPDARVERLVRSNVRALWLCAALALVLPAGCYAGLERQARRLDALGDHGAPATARVTEVTGKPSAFVRYAYSVGGATYTWSVGLDQAPNAVGQEFPILYLPEDPSLNRPGLDRAKAIAEAASNRSFAWKIVAGLFAVLAFTAGLSGWNAARLRGRTFAELTDPKAYVSRLRVVGSIVLAGSIAAFGVGAFRAHEQGESVVPGVLGAGVVVAVLVGAGAWVLRQGPENASARAARLAVWCGWIAAACAALRAIAWVATRH
jgi:hypothetical protein